MWPTAPGRHGRTQRMARRPRLEDQLARLGELGREPDSAESRTALRRAISSRSNILAAKAARVAGAGGVRDLLDPLVEAFGRFMVNPTRNDKGCRAKTAIAHALAELGHMGQDVFLRGLHHVQMEPVYGGRVDTAAELRGACALGLARTGSPDACCELTRLLTDPEPQARIGAVRALTLVGDERAELLLRFRVLTGDPDADVAAECFSALIVLAPDRSIEFVAGFLGVDDAAVATNAAIALGESRRPEALDVLRRHWQQTVEVTARGLLLLPIALTRQDEALEFLLGVVADETMALAQGALTALRLYAGDTRQLRRIRERVVARGDAELTAALAAELSA